MRRRPLLIVMRRRHLALSAVAVIAVLAVFAGTRHPAVHPVSVDISSAVSGRIVVIDPGHGGIDPGAIGHSGSREKDIVLGVAQHLQRELSRAAVYAVMTRTDDRDLADEGDTSFSSRKRRDLARRVDLANNHKADVYVSLHCNSFPSTIWFGAQTFYKADDEQGKQLALSIQGELVSRLGPNPRKAKPGDFRVVNDTKMAAVVVEVGFLSNPREEGLLKDSEYQKKVADAIFHGIVKYFVRQQMRTHGLLPEEPLDPTEGEPKSPHHVEGPPLRLEPHEVLLYFQGPSNRSDGLMAEVRKLPVQKDGASVQASAMMALEELIKGPGPGSILQPTIPPGTTLRFLRIEPGGRAVADFSAELQTKHWGGAREEELTVYSIVNTLTQFAEIKEVVIMIDGKSGATIGGHIFLDRAFRRNESILETVSGYDINGV